MLLLWNIQRSYAMEISLLVYHSIDSTEMHVVFFIDENWNGISINIPTTVQALVCFVVIRYD